MTPPLFALFLDGSRDLVGGKVNLGETLIRVLMYADDVKMFASNPGKLQCMIDKLSEYEYCDLWSFEVNLLKFGDNGNEKRKW